ncbi:MAG: amidohydrolase family protein [Acidobacteriota bacterium]|nr:amidohydrolase family protein [Acidobacteriota bacterium]
MRILTGATIVLPDRLVSGGSVVIDGERIVEVREQPVPRDGVHEHVALPSGGWIVPGLIDVHVHGAGGFDTLGPPGSVAGLAARLPRHGVTAFCPTTVACPPGPLEQFLTEVAALRAGPPSPGSARVLPAHLESNFLAPAFRGAQPAACLRTAAGCFTAAGGLRTARFPMADRAGDFDGVDVLHVVDRWRPAVGIVTLAPELEGGLALVAWLVSRGHRVALGHSGALFDEARAAIGAGARHATHLFNRMPPLGHREPGLAGAVLADEAVAAEVIGDGVHLHPAAIRLTVAAKGTARVMAVSDGTAVAGRPDGARGQLGGEPITVAGGAARLDDGTLAGSAATLDRVFRTLVQAVGLTPVEAAALCATTPARELGLRDQGEIGPGRLADLVLLDADFRARWTWIGGAPAWPGA